MYFRAVFISMEEKIEWKFFIRDVFYLLSNFDHLLLINNVMALSNVDYLWFFKQQIICLIRFPRFAISWVWLASINMNVVHCLKWVYTYAFFGLWWYLVIICAFISLFYFYICKYSYTRRFVFAIETHRTSVIWKKILKIKETRFY